MANFIKNRTQYLQYSLNGKSDVSNSVRSNLKQGKKQ